MADLANRTTKGAGGAPLRKWARKAARAAQLMAGMKPVEGFVDRLIGGEVFGWAFDPNKPTRRVLVVATLDGEIVAEALADLPRRDLAQGGKGDGRHGFTLQLPADLLDGVPRRLRIETSQGRELLKRGEITLTAKVPGAAPKAADQEAAAAGMIVSVWQGVLHGWAVPGKGARGQSVDVFDDERFLGTAELSGPQPEAAGPGARRFEFRLPTLGEESVERLRVRVFGADGDLPRAKGYPGNGPMVAGLGAKGHDQGGSKDERRTQRARPRLAPGASVDRVAMLIHGGDDPEKVRLTARSWTDQNWPDAILGHIGVAHGMSSPAGDNVFGATDETRLAAFTAEASTVLLIRAGETLEPFGARVLAQARPLSDVLTWEISDQRTGRVLRRRSEAWPLAVELGAPLRGGFAVRSAVLAGLPAFSAEALAAGDIRPLETALAQARGLRWAHVPSVLSSRMAEEGLQAHESSTPVRTAETISIGLWPRWDAATLESLGSLIAGVQARIEVLIPSDVSADVEDTIFSMAGAGAQRLRLARVPVPNDDRWPNWLRTLSESSSGDVLVLCRSGVKLTEGGALDRMAAWALHPDVGAVTAPIVSSDMTLAGLCIASGRRGWRVVTAHAPSMSGLSRPVLAAPNALFVVARDKLSAAGGFDSRRIADAGAAFDLSLRLRRMGWSSVLYGTAGGTFDGAGLRRDAGQALALLEPAEIAAAAAAFPAPSEARTVTAS